MSLSFLKDNPLLSDMNDDERDKFVTYLESGRFSKNSTIFVEKMMGESMFFIVGGRVKLTHMVSEGVEKILVELSAGESFGELALIDSGQRAVTARVIEDAEIYKLTRKNFEKLLNDDSDIGKKFLLAILKRVVSDVRQSIPIISKIIQEGEV